MLKFQDLRFAPSPGEIVYTWQCPDTGKLRMWAVGRMAEHYEKTKREIMHAAVDPMRAQWYLTNRGIEWGRIRWLSQNLSKLLVPAILIRTEDGKDLMVDGHHRYVVLAMQRQELFPFYHPTEAEASEFEVTGHPGEHGGYRMDVSCYSGMDPSKRTT